MPEGDAITLFTNALNVINTALEKHAQDTPYRQMLEASSKVLADRDLGVAIYEDDPDAPFDFVTVRFANGRFEIVSHGKRDPEVSWKVSRDYLRSVVDDADRFVEQPWKLDWEWLKSRLGLD
jgi:hypothetical protein